MELFARVAGGPQGRHRPARGRLPGRVHHASGRPRCPTTPTPPSGATSGCKRDLAREPRAASASSSTPGSASEPRRRPAPSTPRSPTCATRGVVFDAGRRGVAAHHRLRRRQGPRPREVRRRAHLPAAATSPTTATSSRAATSCSSTSGAPTTTATSPPKAGVQALGHAPDELEIILGQLVSSCGAARRCGSRSGPATSCCSTTWSTRSGPTWPGSPSCSSRSTRRQTIDLDLVTAQSNENPVFYVQYAHARIHSIGRRAAEAGRRARRRSADADLVAARPRARARPAAQAVRAARGRGPRLRRPRPAQGHHLGARAGRPLPRLLPRLLRDRGRRRPSSPRPACGSSRRPASGSPSASTCSACPPPRRCRRRDGRPAAAAPAARHRRRRRRRPAVASAAATSSSWPSGSARRCSSTTRRHLRARCREAVAAFGDGVAYAVEGVPLPGHGPPRPRGGHAPRRRHRRRAPRRAGRRGARRAARAARQQQVASTSCARPARPASAGSSSTASTSSTASPRCTPRTGIVPQVLVRVTPGVEAHTHEFVRTGQVDSKFGFGVAVRRRGRGRSARARTSPAVELRRRAHAHRQPGVRRRLLPPGRRGRGAVGRASSACPSCRSAAASASPTSRARRRRRSPSGATSVLSRLPGRRHRRPGCSAEPGRAIVAQAGVTLYTVGTVKDVPGVRTYVSVDGGMSDNPRPVLYGSGYEAFLPAGGRRRPAPRGSRSWASTASRATCWCATPRCPTTSPSATCWPRRSPAPTATRWAPTTTRCPARPSCSSPTAQAREVVRRETFDDLLRNDVV